MRTGWPLARALPVNISPFDSRIFLKLSVFAERAVKGDKENG